MGIPSALSSLVILIIRLVFIKLHLEAFSLPGKIQACDWLMKTVQSDAPPYDVSVGIIDTDIWITEGPEILFVELRDAYDKAGNVTVKIAKDQCDQAEAVDKSVSLRQQLKPIQGNYPEIVAIFLLISAISDAFSVKCSGFLKSDFVLLAGNTVSFIFPIQK